MRNVPDDNLPSDPVLSRIRLKTKMGESITPSENQYIQKYGDPWKPRTTPRHLNLGRMRPFTAQGRGFMYVSAEDYERIFGKKE